MLFTIEIVLKFDLFSMQLIKIRLHKIRVHKTASDSFDQDWRICRKVDLEGQICPALTTYLIYDLIILLSLKYIVQMHLYVQTSVVKYSILLCIHLHGKSVIWYIYIYGLHKYWKSYRKS